MKKLEDNEFELVREYMYNNYGIDLSKKKFLVESKLSVECYKRNMATFQEFWKELVQNDEMKQLLIDILTTNYSYFYREEHHFSFLKNQIMKEIQQENIPRYYVWCAGCATGQEVYTVAMQLLECRQLGLLHSDFTVVGTDVSQKVIETAKKAVYGISDYVRLPRLWQQEYCMRLNGESFEIRKEVKKHVMFRQENLKAPLYGPMRYHLILCRNVVIYFDKEGRRKIFETLIKSLQEGGYLFIGHSETLDANEMGLHYVEPSVYKKIGGKAHD